MSEREIEAVEIGITVLLGRARMPVQQLLRMGRGAVIALDAGEEEPVWVLANEHPIARGELIIDGEHIRIELTGPANTQDYMAHV